MITLTLLFTWGIKDLLFAHGGLVHSPSFRIVWPLLGPRPVVLEEEALVSTPAGLFGRPLGDTLGSQAERGPFQLKSPPKAFLFSALVPGAGQIYSQARRGYLFLAVEALAVGGYLLFQHRGKRWKDEYIAFADRHWSEDRYQAWYDRRDSVYNSNLDDSLTHHLPEQKNHDYYEMIGKYDQFVYGWDDVDSTRDDVHSTHRGEYLNIRERSNRYLRWAGYGVGVMLFNRVLSALDAARAARRYNQRASPERAKVNIEFRLRPYGQEQSPEVVLRTRF